MVPAFYIGAQWGVMGLALAWLAGYPVVYAIKAYRTCSSVTLPLLRYVSALLPAIAAGVGMYLAVLGFGWLAPGDTGAWYYLARHVVVGVAAYTFLLYLIDKKGIREAMGFIRS